MKFTIIKYCLVFFTVALTGAMLMVVSHMVRKEEMKLANISRQIESEREKIRILNAEWAFLNDPARLEALSAKYLNLVPPTSSGIIATFEEAMSLDDAPAEQRSEKEMVDAKSEKKVIASSLVQKVSYEQGRAQ